MQLGLDGDDGSWNEEVLRSSKKERCHSCVPVSYPNRWTNLSLNKSGFRV